MGKYDEGMHLYMGTPINDRALLMSYLPFISSIGVKENGEKRLVLKFKGSSLGMPSDVELKVSDKLYDFLSEKIY